LRGEVGLHRQVQSGWGGGTGLADDFPFESRLCLPDRASRAFPGHAL